MTSRRRQRFFARVAEIGASAQAAIPGLYAWAITVAPAAWSRGAPLGAKVAAVIGVLALVTAPVVESARFPSRPAWNGARWARLWSVWGFSLSSALVWALVPQALSSARLDALRGALGMVGWALFAFASAGPSLRVDEDAAARVVAGTPLRPRSELPRGDGAYVAAGVAMALVMQAIGWDVGSPERAVLVRLVTIAAGIAVIGGTTTIALARHTPRVPASPRLRLRRSLPWIVMLVLVLSSGVALTMTR